MKRFAIELGYGADLHGADMTKAAVRAVRDAMSRVCLAGLVEILGLSGFEGVHVHIEVAVPVPEAVDAAALIPLVPIGTVSVNVVAGGLRTAGLRVERFGPDQSDIVAACAALTVSVTQTV
jgi:uncharacterized protein (TIGR02058 family)